MVVFVALLIIFIPILFCFIWYESIPKENHSKKLLGGICPKKDKDNLNEVLRFVRANPNIKYTIKNREEKR